MQHPMPERERPLEVTINNFWLGSTPCSAAKAARAATTAGGKICGMASYSTQPLLLACTSSIESGAERARADGGGYGVVVAKLHSTYLKPLETRPSCLAEFPTPAAGQRQRGRVPGETIDGDELHRGRKLLVAARGGRKGGVNARDDRRHLFFKNIIHPPGRRSGVPTHSML